MNIYSKEWVLSFLLILSIPIENIANAVVDLPNIISSSHADSNELDLQEYQNSQNFFIENKGQIIDNSGKQRSDVFFKAQAGGLNLYFKSKKISYIIYKNELKNNPEDNPADIFNRESQVTAKRLSYRVDMEFLGANPAVSIKGTEPILTYFNYYYSHCPNGITHVKAYKRIVYENIYPNIDLIFTLQGRLGQEGIKYDFFVRPGGKVSDIKIRYQGAKKIIADRSTLQIVTPFGNITEVIPLIYQPGSSDGYSSGRKGHYHKRTGVYNLDKNIVGFKLDEYNSENDLIIDPWATYLGGTAEDMANGIAVDGNNNVVIAGTTLSDNFPTENAWQEDDAGETVLLDIFIAKFDENGVPLWSTYYGGSLYHDYGLDVDVDQAGNIFIAGSTLSADFPVFLGTAYVGGGDGVIISLDPDGLRRWATCQGGAQGEGFRGIATDQAGNVFVTGHSRGTNPLANPATSCYSTYSADDDALLLKFAGDGTPKWITYLAGSGDDGGYAVATDNNGYAYVTGSTTSNNFAPATAGVYQGVRDAFVIAISDNDNKCEMQWGRYLGGNSGDVGNGITVDPGGNVWITGYTSSTSFPIAGPALQTSRGDSNPLDGDAFITKLSPDGSTIVYSTYFGGDALDVGTEIISDIDGNISLTGLTKSNTGFITTQYAMQKNNAGLSDIFIITLNNMGDTLCSTYYGGEDTDEGKGIAIAGNGYIYNTGITKSINFPSDGVPYQAFHAGGVTDAYLIHLCSMCGEKPIVDLPVTDTVCAGDTLIITAVGIGSYTWSTGSITDTTKIVPVSDTTVYVTATLGNCIARDSILIVIRPFLSMPALAGDTVICNGDTAILIASSGVTGAGYTWYSDTGEVNLISNDDTLVTGVLHNDTVYYVKVLSASCESNLRAVHVTVNQNPVLTLKGDTLICAGESTVLTATGATNYTWTWPSGSDTGSSITTNPSSATTYTVTGSNNGCSSVSSIKVYPSAYPVADAGPDQVICLGSSITLGVNTGSTGVAYSWSPASGLNNPNARNPQAKPATTTQYVLTVTENACSSSDTVSVIVEECGSMLYVPSAFSPNADENNLELKLTHKGISKFNIKIYNRWGELLFDADDPDKSWDGLMNGVPAPVGAYVYIVDAIGIDDKLYNLYGTITIIR